MTDFTERVDVCSISVFSHFIPEKCSVRGADSLSKYFSLTAHLNVQSQINVVALKVLSSQNRAVCCGVVRLIGTLEFLTQLCYKLYILFTCDLLFLLVFCSGYEEESFHQEDGWNLECAALGTIEAQFLKTFKNEHLNH